MKKAHLLFLISVLLLQYACTLDGTSWDIDGKGPVLETSFDLSKAIPDQHLQYNTDSAIILNFYDTVYTINLDSIAYIPDSSYLYNINWTLPNFVLPPGASLPPFIIKLRFGISDRLKLNAARINRGRLRVEIKSVIPRNISLNYSIPKATFYGNPLSFTEKISAAAPNDTTFFTTYINLKDYYVDLRGPNQNEYNVLYIYLTPSM
ncbi:MAG: hypothetical protein H3C71_04615, partial [Flavobacteriales bacterium]|nr:hypothetical protein [Flavobacteriales bacterium]